MDLAAVVDAALPGPGGTFDKVSLAGQQLVQRAVDAPGGEPVWKALHGNSWNGHPLHPVVVTLPIGAWATSAWLDARAAATGDERDDHGADVALRVGIAGAALAAATGIAQYVDTRGTARRETTAHASLNTAALALYLGSWVARKKGNRSLGRKLGALGLAVTGVSGYLGGDLSYRHGVGVRPQAFRDPELEAQDSSDAPLELSGSLHR
ncbi:MAG: uncharacterized protein JWO60_1780 [Frankiales bacterium]|nr:uncharacterized protein [Frankiales bacterium]